MAAESKPVMLSLAAISRLMELQVRGKTIPSLVRHYERAMRSGEQFPPIGVADVNGAMILFDGFHRMEARMSMGEHEIAATIVPCHSLEEARWLGFEANLRHGERLTPRRNREAFRSYVLAGKHRHQAHLKSYREVAADILGSSYSTIRRWMQSDFPDVFIELGGGELNGKGGLPDDPPQEARLLDAAFDNIAQAGALMEGVKCPFRRAEAAGRVRALLLLIEPEALSFPTDMLAAFQWD